MSVRQEVEALLAEHGLHPKRALGQNFLIDAHTLDVIAQAATAHDPPALIEIGPGPGTLTRRLMAFGRPLTVIEKDREWAQVLRQMSAVRVIEGDFLDQDLATFFEGLRPAVVGNIPYNVSSPILVALVRQRQVLGPTTLMLQKEVGDRLLAKPGTKAYGSLSVMLQTYADLERIRIVPPGAFLPPPKVHSMVLRISWLPEPRAELGDPMFYEEVVRTAFGQRRKMLRNSLSARFAEAEAAAKEVALDLSRRAETLSVAEFAALARALQRAR